MLLSVPELQVNGSADMRIFFETEVQDWPVTLITAASSMDPSSPLKQCTALLT